MSAVNGASAAKPVLFLCASCGPVSPRFPPSPQGGSEADGADQRRRQLSLFPERQGPRLHGGADRPVLCQAPRHARRGGCEAAPGILHKLRPGHRGPRAPPPDRPPRLQRQGRRRPAPRGRHQAEPRASRAARGRRRVQGHLVAAHQCLRHPRPEGRATAWCRGSLPGADVLRLRGAPAHLQARCRNVQESHARGPGRQGPRLFLCRRLLSQLHQSQRLWLDSGPPRRERLAGSRDASLATSDTAFARVAGHLSPILQVDACVASSIRPSGGPETRDRAAQGEGQGGHCCTRQHGTARVEGRRASGTIDIFPHVMMDESCSNPFQPATGRDASSVAEAAAIQNSTSCMTRNEERAATLKASGCCE